MLLEVRDLNVYYGAVHALQGVSFYVEEGEIVCLIGANGAGKSTTLRAISGLVPAESGAIYFRGEEITGVAPHRIVDMGISQVPEGRRIFDPLSVRENLVVGAYTRKDRQAIKETMSVVFRHFPRLDERLNQAGGTLSGGEQQMLTIGRGLMSDPTLLLLDEPSLGLAPMLTEEIFKIIRRINQEGTSVLLVEQNAAMALELADRGYVMETGTIALEGPSQALLEDPLVQTAYLGEAQGLEESAPA